MGFLPSHRWVGAGGTASGKGLLPNILLELSMYPLTLLYIGANVF